jgi:kinesin family protein 5
LQREQPDIEKITQRVVKQELDSQKKEFDVIRNQLEKDLHNRIDKVIKLELQLEEVKDAYKSLEHSISRDDLKFKQKAQNLEKNLEQIH